jgi:cobalamin biosynthesis Mg chelatase CobN
MKTAVQSLWYLTIFLGNLFVAILSATGLFSFERTSISSTSSSSASSSLSSSSSASASSSFPSSSTPASSSDGYFSASALTSLFFSLKKSTSPSYLSSSSSSSSSSSTSPCDSFCMFLTYGLLMLLATFIFVCASWRYFPSAGRPRHYRIPSSSSSLSGSPSSSRTDLQIQ